MSENKENKVVEFPVNKEPVFGIEDLKARFKELENSANSIVKKRDLVIQLLNATIHSMEEVGRMIKKLEDIAKLKTNVPPDGSETQQESDNNQSQETK